MGVTEQVGLFFILFNVGLFFKTSQQEQQSFPSRHLATKPRKTFAKQFCITAIPGRTNLLKAEFAMEKG